MKLSISSGVGKPVAFQDVAAAVGQDDVGDVVDAAVALGDEVVIGRFGADRLTAVEAPSLLADRQQFRVAGFQFALIHAVNIVCILST